MSKRPAGHTAVAATVSAAAHLATREAAHRDDHGAVPWGVLLLLLLCVQGLQPP